MILRLRSIRFQRALSVLFMSVLLLAALCAASANYGERRIYTPAAVEQAIRNQGAELLSQPLSATDATIRAVSPRHYLIGSASNAAAGQETVTVYVFSTEAECSKGEGELRAAFAADGSLLPVVYDRRNVLIVYRPLAVVNQTGTKYGELLRSALDSL